jgi:thioredoxin reductase (NADPH)
MTPPIIFVIDDDPQVLRAITRDLRTQFRQHYRILSTSSVKEALDSLLDLKNKGETIAVFVSDQRMPEMEGVEFLQKAREFFPDAKRVLLTAYSDTDAAIKAINNVQLDYYLMKPWDPPEEKLYPVINELLDDWQNSFRPPFKGIKVIGYQFSPKSHEIKEFLSGNLVPYQWQDVELSKEAQDLLKLNNIALKDLPALFLEDGSCLCSPGIPQVASKIGLNPTIKNDHRRRARRARRFGLRRFGRAQDVAGGTAQSRRTGGHLFPHRKLSGFPQWPQRLRADTPRDHSGDQAGRRSPAPP